MIVLYFKFCPDSLDASWVKKGHQVQQYTPYVYVLVIERLKVDMNKMANLLKCGCLGSCWEISIQSKGVNQQGKNHIASPVEMLCGSSLYVNRGPMQNVRSENVQKQVIHTVEAKH